jgi:phosphoglycolate phosphatase
MTKLVVFDIDGTILNSFEVFEELIAEYSRQQGLTRPCMETIKLGYGDPHNHDFKWGLSRVEQVQHMRAAWEMCDAASTSGRSEHTPHLFDGVKDVLYHLKNAGHTLAVVTSKPEVPLLHSLNHHGIIGLFSSIRTLDDIKKRGLKEKPEPDMLLSIMDELSFAPENTVMIGDTTMDIRMGRSAAAHTIGVSWGAHPKGHLTEAGAHHIVEHSFNSILSTVQKIFSPGKK